MRVFSLEEYYEESSEIVEKAEGRIIQDELKKEKGNHKKWSFDELLAFGKPQREIQQEPNECYKKWWERH